MAAIKLQKHLSLSLLFKRKVVTVELRIIEITTSSRGRTVLIAKTYAMTHRKNLLGQPFDVTQRINSQIPTRSVTK